MSESRKRIVRRILMVWGIVVVAVAVLAGAVLTGDATLGGASACDDGTGVPSGEVSDDAAGPGTPSFLARAAEASSPYGARYRLEGVVTVGSDTRGEVVPGRARVEASGERNEVITPMSGRDVRVIGDRPCVYVEPAAWPRAAGEVPPGTRWMRTDENEIATGGSPITFSVLRELQIAPPGRQVEILQAIASKFQRMGSDRVGGVRATHYGTVVRFGDLLAELGDPEQLLPEISEEDADAKASYEIWIDEADRFRRAEMYVVLTGVLETEIVGITNTVEVVSLDRDLQVAVPTGPGVYDVTASAG